MSRFGILMLVAKAVLVLSQIVSAASGDECKPTNAAKVKVAQAAIKARQNAQPVLPDSLPDKTGLVPIPETVPLPPPADEQNARNAGSHDAKIQPADSRPVVFLYTTPECHPCQVLKKRIKNGSLQDFRVEVRDAPEWVSTVPRFHFNSRDGWLQLSATGDDAEFRLMRAWIEHNGELPVARGVPQASAGGASVAGQAARFLGSEGTIVVTPKSPIIARMDDGTMVSYSRLTVAYTVKGSDITMTLSQPLPEAHVKKFGMWWAAQILSGSTVERDGKVTVTIRTTKGTYRVDLTEVSP